MSKFIDSKERDIIFPILHETDREVIQEGGQYFQKYKHDIVKNNIVHNLTPVKGDTGRDFNHLKGDYSEALAKAHFIMLGYFVFPQESTKGYIDLIIIDKDGLLVKIDVKTITYRKDTQDSPYRISANSPTKQQKKHGVKLMHIDIDQQAFFMS